MKARELNSGATQMGRSSYQVPDRVTGWQEIQELRHICPGRVWNFVGAIPIQQDLLFDADFPD